MTQEDIQTVLSGLTTLGEQYVYDLVKTRLLAIMCEKKNLDDMTLDAYETLLDKARKEEDNNKSYLFYKASRIFRRLAHEIYRIYIKNGEQRDNPRFLRVVK